MDDLSVENLQAIAGHSMDKYTEAQLKEIVRTGELPK